MFKKNKKEEKIYLSEKEYACYLAHVILTSGSNGFSEIRETLEPSKHLLYYYLRLLLHYLYICEFLLHEKYYQYNIDNCINLTIDYIVESIDLPTDSKQLMRDMYADTKSDYYNIYTEDGIHGLVSSYQGCLENNKGVLLHTTLFVLFSGFIIHHTSDIVGDKIIITFSS